MISITEEISALRIQEQLLHTSLDNLRGQKSLVKEHKQLEKELAVVLRKRQNLQAWAAFEVGMPVYRLNSRKLGIVKELKITPGGMREVWVSWDGLLQIPEQPNLLQIDGAAMAKIIAVGDLIEIVDGHEEAGKTFAVERLLALGAVETADEIVFKREEWQKVQNSIQSEGDEDSIHNTVFNQEISMGSSPTEELGERTPEITLTITAIAQLEELTEDEEQERHRLESKVEKAFREAGSALQLLRDKKLYRSTHKTFEAYCRERFGYSRDTAYLKIAAATVYDNIQKYLPTNGRQIFMPTNERQLRDIAKANFEPEVQAKAWIQTLQKTDGRQPTGKEVKGIVERLKEKPLFKASDFCCTGDVFTLTRLEGSNRKYNGCWAIANELRDFTIAVDVYDGEIAVKPDNLNPIDLPDVRRQLPETLRRIKRLRESDLLSRCAYTILESIGRQIYLDDFEEKLLAFMEQEYKIY